MHAVPFLDLVAQYQSIREEIDAAVARVLASGWYVLSPEVDAFEKALAAFLTCDHVIGVGSGTGALQVALLAAGIGAGDEVITVSHTAVATVAAIRLVGAKPVFADIDPVSYTADPAAVEATLTPRTRAILPVHLYGNPADMAPLMRIANQHGLTVIEDCAQAVGSCYQGQITGSFGRLSTLSFYPTKNLGAMGDAGAVATSDPDLAQRARGLRQYGWQTRYVSEEVGVNSRLDPIQAAILEVKLAHLADWTKKRRALAQRYNLGLRDTSCLLPRVRSGDEHVYHLYVIRHPRRDALAAYLATCGVGTLIHYPVPVHLQPAYSDLGYRRGSLPETERAASEILSLPLYPELRLEQVDTVCELIRAFEKDG